jgi:hypothetical protein
VTVYELQLSCRYTPSRVPSMPIIIFIEEMICWAIGGDMADA